MAFIHLHVSQITNQTPYHSRKATYVAPSQVLQGKSLDDEVFQSIFISSRDFKPATTIIQTAGQRDVYFNVKDAHNKMIKTYKEEVIN